MTIIQSFVNVPTELITFLIGGGIIGVIISIISLLLMDSAKTKWTWKENLFFIFFYSIWNNDCYWGSYVSISR